MSSWTLKSIPPHDWFIGLDINSYFDHEHDPEKIFEEGFTRPVPVNDHDVLVTVFFNGDPENPEFHIESQESLSRQEIEGANKSLVRILGTGQDLRPLYDQASDDPLLGDKLSKFYGLKRMSRANLFEDILNRIVQMQIHHAPTARKMMFKVRESYGTALMHHGQNIPAWPRPHQLMKADPAQIRRLGPTKRKGEYMVDLAGDIIAGEIDMDFLEKTDPVTFYNTIKKVRGIGPTSAQDLMLMRNRVDGFFPSEKKGGEEKGLRRWIIYSYGGDPDHTTEEEFQEMITNWKGFEGAALEFLYVNYVIREKEKKAKGDN